MICSQRKSVKRGKCFTVTTLNVGIFFNAIKENIAEPKKDDFTIGKTANGNFTVLLVLTSYNKKYSQTRIILILYRDHKIVGIIQNPNKELVQIIEWEFIQDE